MVLSSPRYVVPVHCPLPSRCCILLGSSEAPVPAPCSWWEDDDEVSHTSSPLPDHVTIARPQPTPRLLSTPCSQLRHPHPSITDPSTVHHPHFPFTFTASTTQ